MRRVIIVQARMTSSRLPGKILMDVAGQPMLAQQLRRLKACKAADEIIIATTTNPADDSVIELARHEGVGWFRGSEPDVLARYVGAAHQARADVVVRVTADCPLIDPEVTDQIINELVNHRAECDYVSNVEERTFPHGLDVEAFFFDTLLRAERLGRSAAAREHVTVVMRAEYPDLFLRRSVHAPHNAADLRWTVDTAEDLQLVRSLYDDLDLGTRMLGYEVIVAYARAHPELARINASSHTWQPKPCNT
ncbi:cytidylyltransferase domain-containing protein [Candidatus Chloroploca sp. Khr17]|uniref:cytidylyltransferase domain-containing protein n=1 Tax=Candidatus Chloroploca sp. Khr17 TaxID=2496869 RepID=UPI00101D56B5|nr:glycosyltransferase family protein [Candidatus Chloroploca sp. Khr17]